MSVVDFKELLQESVKLHHTVDAYLPVIERGAEQLDEMTRKLAFRSTGIGDTATNKAHTLLASQGFDTEKLERNLTSVHLRQTFESLEATCDIETVLKHEQEMSIVTILEESKKESLALFDHSFALHSKEEWEQAKKAVNESFGQFFQKGDWRSPTTLLSNNLSIHIPNKPSSTAPDSRTLMTPQMIDFAHVLYDLNDHMDQNLPYQLASAFHSVVKKHAEKGQSTQLLDCWSLVRQIVGEDENAVGHTQQVVPSVYQQPYLEGDKQLKSLLVARSRQFLEKQFRSLLENFVHANLAQAKLGGVPDLLSQIKGFLNITLQNKGTWGPEFSDFYQNYPVWALIFYCIRCGDLQTAFKVIQSAKGVVADSFVSLFHEYMANPYQPLKEHTWVQLVQDFRRNIKQASDPFKQAVYLLVGRCDRDMALDSVFSTAEDFVWSRLCLLVESPTPTPPELLPHILTLSDLQSLFLEYGPAHFNPQGRNPLLYFQILILTQQYERALWFLAGVDLYTVDAVHFAVVLYHYGLLRTAPAADPSLPFLALTRFIVQYTSKFSSTDCQEALHYFRLFRDEQDRLDHITTLVTETREYKVLLGGVRANGSRKPGALDRFLDSAAIQTIAARAAEAAEAQGQLEEAIDLFDIAEQHLHALELVNKQLSLHLVTASPTRDNLRTLAQALEARYTQQGVFKRLLAQTSSDSRGVAIKQSLTTFAILRRMLQFFTLVQAEKYREGHAVVCTMALIPLTQNDIQPALTVFSSLDACVRYNIAETLLATMTCIFKLYEQIKATLQRGTYLREISLDDSQKLQLELNSLKEEAECLVTYSGSIEYRLPGDTNARLVRMQVNMC